MLLLDVDMRFMRLENPGGGLELAVEEKASTGDAVVWQRVSSKSVPHRALT